MLETVKYSAKINGDQWVVLTSLGFGRWQVQLWGTETMQVEFVGLTSSEAKERAVALVSLFFLGRNGASHLPNELDWRAVSSITRRRYRFQSTPSHTTFQ
jgi:hypothetical protein